MFLAVWDFIVRFAVSADSVCGRLSRSQKFYLVGLVLILLSGFAYLFSIKAFFALCVFGVCVLVGGITSDILIIYHRVWATVIGKAVILLLYTLAVAVAYGAAKQVVNGIARFDTSELTNTVSFVAVLLVPLFILLSTYSLFFIIMVFGQVYILAVMFLDSKIHADSECLRKIAPKNLEEYRVLTLMVRFIVYPAVIGFAWGSLRTFAPAYEKFIAESTSAFIYNFEAVPFSRCKTEAGVKVLKVNDDEILVVKKVRDNYLFEPMICVPRLKAPMSSGS